MRRGFWPSFLLLLIFFSPRVVFAQAPPPEVKEFLKKAAWQGEKQQFWDWGEERSKTGKVLAEKAPEEELLPQPKGFLPDHPLYFLKRLQEGVGLALTFDPAKKEEKRLNIAQERLAEANKLLERGKTNLAQKAINNYVNQVAQVAQKLAGIPQEEKKKVLAQKLETIAARHELVLEKVLEKVPKPAKPAIGKALVVSQKGMDTAADVLGRPPLPLEFKARLEALKRQALVTPEEAAAIVSSRSRSEAREKIKQLLKEGKIPEADFKLLDGAQKLIAPEEFEKIRERKKLEELRKLEAQKPPKEIQRQIDEFLRNYKPGNPVPPRLLPHLSFQRIEELKKTIRPEVLIEEEIKKADFVGPGGCFNEQTCRAYCSQPVHQQECLEFLKTAPEWIKKQAKSPLMQELGCTDETSCRAICEKDPARCEKFGKGPQPRAGGPRVGPGGCQTRRECEQYCSDPAHREECQKFGPPPEGGEEAKGSPGASVDCKSEEECRAYCQLPQHQKECLSPWKMFAAPEGAPGFRPQGPGEKPPMEEAGKFEDERKFCQINPDDPRCQGKPEECRSEEECQQLCEKNPNNPICQGKPEGPGPGPSPGPAGPPAGEKPPEGQPPQGMSPEEMMMPGEKPPEEFPGAPPFGEMPLEEMPPEIEEQMGQVKGWFAVGNKGPGGCEGVFSCYFYCSSPLHWQECLR